MVEVRHHARLTLATDPVEAARRLAATAAELAPEAERDRQLAEPLVAALADAGLFRLCVPAAAGGLEAHPGTLIAAVRALAAGDAAAAWCVAVAATSGLLAGYLPEESARAIYAEPATMVAGRVRAQGPRDAGAGRLPRQRPLAVRERLPARRLADGRLRRRRAGSPRMLPTGCPTCG